jgi:hypothetical protein
MTRETIMVAPRTGLLKAVCLSAALMGAVSGVITLGLAEPVHAAGGNGKGNGNAGGNGKGNGAESRGKNEKSSASSGDRAGSQTAKGASGKAAGNSGGGGGEGGTSFSGSGDSEDKQPATSSKTQTKSKVTAETAKAKAPAGRGNRLARELGVHPSELGALNAANASDVALSNASKTSRVGRIAACRDAVLAGQLIQVDYDAAVEALEAFEGDYRTSSFIETEIARLEQQVAELEMQLPATEETIPETEEVVDVPADDVIEAEPAPPTPEQQIGDLQGQITALELELAEAVRYEEAVGLVEKLDAQREIQLDVERSLLEAAANKPVTDEVEAAVQKLLGID